MEDSLLPKQIACRGIVIAVGLGTMLIASKEAPCAEEFTIPKTVNIYMAARSIDNQPQGVLILEAVAGGGCNLVGPPLVITVADHSDPIVVNILGHQPVPGQDSTAPTCDALTISEVRIPIQSQWLSTSSRQIDFVLSGVTNHYRLSTMRWPTQVVVSLSPLNTKNVFSNYGSRNETAVRLDLTLIE